MFNFSGLQNLLIVAALLALLQLPAVYHRYCTWRIQKAIKHARVTRAAERLFQQAAKLLESQQIINQQGVQRMDDLAALRRDGYAHSLRSCLPTNDALLPPGYISETLGDLVAIRHYLFKHLSEISEIETCSSTASSLSYEFVLSPKLLYMADTPSPTALAGDELLAEKCVIFKLRMFCLRVAIRSYGPRDSVLSALDTVVINQTTPLLISHSSFGLRGAVLELYADSFHFLGSRIDIQIYKEMVAQVLTCDSAEGYILEYTLSVAFSLINEYIGAASHILALLQMAPPTTPLVFTLLCLSLTQRVDIGTHRTAGALFAHYAAITPENMRFMLSVALSRYLRVIAPNAS